MSSVARCIGVRRETLRDSLKLTERQRERRPERRGRPRKLTPLQARRGSPGPRDTEDREAWFSYISFVTFSDKDTGGDSGMYFLAV